MTEEQIIDLKPEQDADRKQLLDCLTCEHAAENCGLGCTKTEQTGEEYALQYQRGWKDGFAKGKEVFEQQTGDAVSREAVCNYIAEFVNNEYSTQAECEMVGFMIDGIQHLPSVTPKSGKWHIAHGMYEDRFWCSCGYIRIMDSRMNEWKYCPVCGGAKMIEPQERSGEE